MGDESGMPPYPMVATVQLALCVSPRFYGHSEQVAERFVTGPTLRAGKTHGRRWRSCSMSASDVRFRVRQRGPSPRRLLPMTAALTPPVAPGSPPARRRRSPYRRPTGRPPQSGATTLTRVLRTVRLDSIDQRSQVGVALRRLREELVDHLGGEVTATQRILVEETAKARVIATAVG